MTKNIRVGVQLWPGGTPDYRTWREAVLTAEELGADAIFGYDHFHKPFTEPSGGTACRCCCPSSSTSTTSKAGPRWRPGLRSPATPSSGLLVTGHRLPQSRPAGRHGPHRGPHQRRQADPRPGSGLVRKDYTVYGYDFGTVKSRMDLFEDSLARIENRLTQLVPSPVRQIPILIGGMGVKRTLPIVAKHADIWHTFASVRRVSAARTRCSRTCAAEAGRDEKRIERAVHWTGRENADAFVDRGRHLVHHRDPPDRRWLRLRRAEGHAGLAGPAALTVSAMPVRGCGATLIGRYGCASR